ncbi:MAG: protein kinase [bacterium]|nr:protein kinase [bacterium]
MIAHPAPTYVNNRYRIISELGHGGMSAVYTAQDRLTGQEVALKQIYIRRANRSQVSISTETSEKRLVLAQEFRTLAAIRHPNIISVLDYGFDSDAQPFYVMELLRNARTLTEAGIDEPLAVKLDLLIQLLNALVYLHRRGILHRDLKPANILVVSGTVKVLDFGLAIEEENLSSGSNELVGTLQYIAPEVFMGANPSEASELYAVGVIVYEMFLGRPPFDTKDLRALLNNPVTVELPDHDPRLIGLITELLSKRPEHRPASASQVLSALHDLAGRADRHDDSTVRESFIQAARFVGRAGEMALLRAALKDMIKGSGGLWLVGGESGVGKSRLMDEIRTLGLIEGAIVLRGQAINAGGSPYALFQEVVRRLCLNLDPATLPLSILKTIVPDIGTLFGMAVPDAPHVEPQNALSRLIKAVTDLLLEQHQPLLVLLEDLQWAGDSLALLDGLSQLIKAHKLLVIGSYRSDEAPDLPSRFPQAQVIQLARLNTTEIEQFTTAVLGNHPAQSRVTELLERETEGNIFFIVEVLRSLAEQAGHLEQIGVDTLPVHVFSGGIFNVVRHRLEQLPPHSIPLLQLAAVMGREVQPAVLQKALELRPQLGQGLSALDQWLNDCLARAVLALQDERWLFAHDKIREIALRDIEARQLPALHELAAQTLEAYHGNSPNGDAALAYHWRMAGNDDKELFYAARLGELNVSTGAYAQAIESLNRVVALMVKKPNFDKLNQARMYRLLGQAYFYSGQIEAAQEFIYKAVAHAVRGVPENPLLFRLDTISQMTQQISRRIRKAKPRLNPHKDREKLLESGRSLFLLGEMTVYTGDNSRGTYVGMRALNESERAGASDALIRHLTGTAWVLSSNPKMSALSRQYLALGLEVADHVNDLAAYAFADFIAALLGLQWGEWEQVRKHAERGVERAKASGDLRTWVAILGVLGDFNAFHRGQFEESVNISREAILLTTKMGSINQLALEQSRHALYSALLGDWERAVYDAETALGLEKPQNLTFLNAYCALVLDALYRDHYAAAVERLNALLERIEGITSLNIYAMIDGCMWCTDGWLTLAEIDRAYLPQARRALAQLERAAAIYPIAQPRHALYRGWLAHLDGQPEALQQTETALERARTLNMPHDEGLALWQLSRFAPDEAKRHEYHNQAVKQFSKLLTAYDLRRALRSTGGDQAVLSTKPG